MAAWLMQERAIHEYIQPCPRLIQVVLQLLVLYFNTLRSQKPRLIWCAPMPELHNYLMVNRFGSSQTRADICFAIEGLAVSNSMHIQQGAGDSSLSCLQREIFAPRQADRGSWTPCGTPHSQNKSPVINTSFDFAIYIQSRCHDLQTSCTRDCNPIR